MAAAVTAPIAANDPRHRSYDCKSPDEHKALYDQWASSYNDDVLGNTTLYVGPTLTVQAVLAFNGRVDGQVLDAGCGTGLCGVALNQVGARAVDGIDLSPGMLKIARDTGVYRDLIATDMCKPLEMPDGKYDVVTCVGTFTTSHVGPDPAIPELVRVLKKGGILVATVLDEIWKSGGYEAEVEKLRESSKVEVLSTEKVDYRKAENAQARMLVLRSK